MRPEGRGKRVEGANILWGVWPVDTRLAVPLQVCQLLLTWPDHPAHADAQESRALIHAAMMGNVPLCELLLGQRHHPARADARDSEALMGPCWSGHLSVCQLLLSQVCHGRVCSALSSHPQRVLKCAFVLHG